VTVPILFGSGEPKMVFKTSLVEMAYNEQQSQKKVADSMESRRSKPIGINKVTKFFKESKNKNGLFLLL
jgi:hypothetical protein